MKKHLILLLALIPAIVFALPKPNITAPIDLKDPVIPEAPTYLFYVIDLIPSAVNTENGIIPVPESRKQRENEQRNNREAIVQWRVHKSNNIYFVECITRSGHKGETWYMDGVQVRTVPGLTGYFVDVMHSPLDAMNLNFGRTGYPWTNWVAIDNFTGKFSISGQDALGFKSKVRDKNGTFQAEAYVHEKLRIPLIVQYGEKYYSFTHYQAPQTPIVVPEKVTEAEQKHLNAGKRLMLVPNRPY